MIAPENKTAGADLRPLRRCLLSVQDFLQHLAQPAASVQHLVQVAVTLQQPPSHFIAVAGLEHEPSLQLAQPVLNSPAASTVARIIIFIVWSFVVRGLVFLRRHPRLPSEINGSFGRGRWRAVQRAAWRGGAAIRFRKSRDQFAGAQRTASHRRHFNRRV